MKRVIASGHRWTDKELKRLMGRWLAEVEIDEIAREFQTTHYAINKQIGRMRQEGIPMPRRNAGHVAGRNNKPWTPQEAEYLIRRREDQVTAEKIADELDRSFLGVQGMIRQLRKEGVPVKMLGNGVRRLWNPEVLKMILHGRMDTVEGTPLLKRVA